MIQTFKRSLAILLVITFLLCGATNRDTETWVSCSFKEDSLSSSSAESQTYYTDSQLYCVSLATMVEWAYVSLFYVDQEKCLVLGLQFMTDGEVTKDPALGSVKCKTTLRNAVCHTDDTGNLFTYGELTPDDAFCPDNRNSECTEEDGVRRYPEPLATCSTPFSATPIGCIFISSTSHVWCDARSQCLDLGGDLMSFGTSTDFESMIDHLQSERVSDDMWAGLRFENGAWGYLANTRNPGARSSGDWSNGNPDGGAETCAYISPGMGYKMADKECTLTKLFICHAVNAA